ncbi:MAG: hypothetical protein ACO1OK_07670 [Devosia sp.]|uniref:Uncharacterized protein n=1 Tax=Devosia enhydra TaxID=665118 RepID=A0A1K2I4Z4_9HYPH|nr:hypothetical protein [Devosia enhydra]SFZ86804.1 hypothetical protein SAMN02983003_3998 [Devosia enhydra]
MTSTKSNGFMNRARNFVASAESLFAVAGAIEGRRRPARADLERLGIDADSFYKIG